jgi:hypothetical protein
VFTEPLPDDFKQVKNLLYLQGSKQFEPDLLEMRYSFEVIGEMAAHFINAHRF